MPRAVILIGILLCLPLGAANGAALDNTVGAPDGAAPTETTDALELILEPVGAPPSATPPQESNPNGAVETPQPIAPKLRVMKAYYVGYADDSFDAVRDYTAFVDIVAGQWLAVDANGRLREAPSVTRNDQVRRIVHDAGKKVYSCVVNKDFSRTVLTRVLNSPARRTSVVDQIVAFVMKKGDDGVDLDFEGVSAEHRAGYTAFVKDLSEKLHARGKELSLAVDVEWDGGPARGFDYAALSRYADSIMPMSYTFGPGRTPAAPMAYLEGAARLGIREMAPEKFMIGIGVYGRDFNTRTGRKTNPNTRTIQSLLSRYNPVVKSDPKTLTKTFAYTDDKGHRHEVFYDDPETIREKLARLTDRYQVSAVGFWRMGQEDPALWPTLEVASGRNQPDATASVDGKWPQVR